jgi:hypothetical protein
MKRKDFWKKLADQGKIDKEEYKAFMEAETDGEIPDAIFSAIEEKFMTIDRAAAHPEVSKKIRFETLNPLSRDLEKMMGVLGAIDPYTARDIQKLTKQVGDREVPDTYKQFEAITASLPKLFDKVKVAPDDVEAKKQIEELKKVNEEFTEKFNNFKKEKDEEVKSVRTESEKHLKDYKLNSFLEKKAGSYTFADGFKDARPILTKAILGELRSKNHLDFATNEGEEVVGVFDLENGVPRPKFNGNSAVTLDTLLDEAFKPYLKVNGVEPDQQQQTRHQQFQVSSPKQNGQGRKGGNVAASV